MARIGLTAAIVLCSGVLGGGLQPAAASIYLPFIGNSFSPAVQLEAIGQAGGINSDLAVDGDLLALGAGPRLMIYRRTGTESPRLVARTEPLGAKIADVILDDGFAYVAMSGPTYEQGRLQILELPTNGPPIARGSLQLAIGTRVVGRRPFAFKLGEMLVVTSSDVPTLIDVGNPDHPRLVASLSNSFVTAAALDGTVLWLVVENSGWLAAWDLSTPRAPRQLGRVALPPTTLLQRWPSLAAGGGYVFVGNNDDSDGRLAIYNASGGWPPRQMGEAPFPGRIVGLADGMLYLWQERGDRLLIIDVGHPGAPTVRNTVSLPNGSEVQAVVDGRVYLRSPGDAHNQSTAWQILELARPGLPPKRFSTPNLWITDVAAVGSRLYAATPIEGDNDGAMWVLDPDDLDALAPARCESESLSGIVAVRGSLAFEVLARRLRVHDLADPACPRLVAEAANRVGSEVLGMGLGDNAVYVLKSGELNTFDVYDPYRPRRTSDLQVTDNGGMVTRPGASWLATFRVDRPDTVMDPDLTLFDTSDPAHPTLSARLTVPGRIETMAAAGDTLYVMATEFTVKSSKPQIVVVDVADSAAPRIVGRAALPFVPMSAIAQGRWLLIRSDTWLGAVDVSNPAQPFPAQSVPLPHTFNASDWDPRPGRSGIAVIDDRLFLATADYGLAVYRMTSAK